MFLSFAVFVAACSHVSNPSAPSTNSTLIKVQDTGSSNSVTIISTQTFNMSASDGMTGPCSGVSLDCSGNNSVPVVLAIPTTGTFNDGTINVAAPSGVGIVINNGPSLGGILTGIGSSCSEAYFVSHTYGESQNLGNFRPYFNSNGPSTVTVGFDGCHAFWFSYSYNAPVTLVVTATPGPATNTFTPTPSPTFTPSPTPTTCGGSNCVDAAPEIRQCNPSWKSTPLAGGNDASPEANICNSGCLLTCLAMSNRRDPSVLNNLFTQAGNVYNDSGGIFVEQAAESLGWDVTQVSSLTDDEVAAELCVKQHVVAQISHPGTHYILVTGRTYDPATKRCRITINDPADQSKKFLDDPSYTGVNKVMIFNPSPLGN